MTKTSKDYNKAHFIESFTQNWVVAKSAQILNYKPKQ